MDLTRSDIAYEAYFRFNNQRTLSTLEPSGLEVFELENIKVFRDPTRKYDNQIMLQSGSSFEALPSALALFPTAVSPEISIESDLSEELRALLQQKGMVEIFKHEFLSMPASAYRKSPTDSAPVHVERWGKERTDDFLELLKTSGLECSEPVWQSKRHLYCTDTFRCYVAYRDGLPCAWATSFIDADVAILANAFTQEMHRGMGCQTALLHARVIDAITLGCDLLLTDVMANSTSSRNSKAVGFQTYSLKRVWGVE